MKGRGLGDGRGVCYGLHVVLLFRTACERSGDPGVPGDSEVENRSRSPEKGQHANAGLSLLTSALLLLSSDQTRPIKSSGDPDLPPVARENLERDQNKRSRLIFRQDASQLPVQAYTQRCSSTRDHPAAISDTRGFEENAALRLGEILQVAWQSKVRRAVAACCGTTAPPRHRRRLRRRRACSPRAGPRVSRRTPG